MLANPQPGQRVLVWYKKSLADWFPYHGKIGVVRIVGKNRKPRNHGVEIDGKLIVLPCGNLRKVKEP